MCLFVFRSITPLLWCLFHIRWQFLCCSLSCLSCYYSLSRFWCFSLEFWRLCLPKLSKFKIRYNYYNYYCNAGQTYQIIILNSCKFNNDCCIIVSIYIELISTPNVIKSNGTHIILSSDDVSAFEDLLTAANMCK